MSSIINKKKEINTAEELPKLLQYIQATQSEKSKQHLVYPFFEKIFKGKDRKFTIENEAEGADIYIEGQLVVECKSDYKQWLEGFYQALHYKHLGLSYNTIMVISTQFVGIWKLDKLPKEVHKLRHKADAHIAPNKIGKQYAKDTKQDLKIAIQKANSFWIEPNDFSDTLFQRPKGLTGQLLILKDILLNIEDARIRIHPKNFILHIEQLKKFFEKPIDAIHCFYSILTYWDETSTISERPNGALCVNGFNHELTSDDIVIAPRNKEEFKKFITDKFVFTNKGSGITYDYYFSRFDEALATIDADYIKQHGIFFTDDNLSKFALWFVKENFSKELHEKYIVFDPAGGSGNLVSSWREELKHKIISEINPDLLKIIERRLNADPFHQKGTKFTIIPKTVTGQGLNFIDCSAEKYFNELKKAVKENVGLPIDKPLAFLLNPPYKNTDENIAHREKTDAVYEVHDSIIQLSAGKERYAQFLAQILNISKEQVKEYSNVIPAVMIFTPTSWLIPRNDFISIRANWDKYFVFHSGFLVNGKAFFKLPSGQDWGISFTIWSYKPNEKGNDNKIRLLDLTHLEKNDLASISWGKEEGLVDTEVKKVLKGGKRILLINRGDIRDTLPFMNRNDEMIRQPRFNFYRNKNKDEKEKKIISGFPLKDDRHERIKAPHGYTDGTFVGLMDNNTPVRLRQESCSRLSNLPDRVWFRLDTAFQNINDTKIFSCPADNRSFCAYDLPSAKSTFSWFAITKALNGVYPIWANQNDIWMPSIKIDKEKYWHSLCFAFSLAENRCIVTKFESDNPIKGAKEIEVDNPLCPTNPDSFWSKVLSKEIISKPSLSKELVNKIEKLYEYWNTEYMKGKFKKEVSELQDEPYFKYFDSYAPFLTPYSGLIQIRKYAEKKGAEDLLNKFKEISEQTKKVKEEIHRLLVEDFKYFD